MNKQIYIQHRGVERGPFRLDEMRRLYEQKALTDDVQCRSDGMVQWLPYPRFAASVISASTDASEADATTCPPPPQLPPPLPAAIRCTSLTMVSSEKPREWRCGPEEEWFRSCASLCLSWVFPASPELRSDADEQALLSAAAAVHRTLIWLIALYIPALFLPSILWGLIPLQLVLQMRLMRLLRWSAGWIIVTTVGSLVPYLGSLWLLGVYVNATRRLVGAGYGVGFWGLRPRSPQTETGVGSGPRQISACGSDKSQAEAEQQRPAVGYPHWKLLVDFVVVSLAWVWCAGILTWIGVSTWIYYEKRQPVSGGRAVGLMLALGKSLEFAWAESVALRARLSGLLNGQRVSAPEAKKEAAGTDSPNSHADQTDQASS